MDLKTRLAENIYQTIKMEKLNTNEIVKLLRQVELEVLEKQISETHNPGERYVLHKNGYIQKFSKQKMFFDIASNSEFAECPMNEYDINIVTEDVLKNFKNRQLLTTGELKNWVREALYSNGYKSTANRYK